MLLSERCRVVLYEPRDPINGGSVVRVCRNTGISDLRFIRPVYGLDARVMSISAPNSDAWISTHASSHDDWSSALDGATRAYALTARRRDSVVPGLGLDNLVDHVLGHDEPFALVFGPEDHGLPNEVVDRCTAYVTVETDAAYPSLNLAQCVLLVAHRLYMAHDVSDGKTGDESRTPMVDAEQRADLGQIERMMRDTEEALDRLGYFKGSQRQNVLASMQRVFTRADLSRRELGLFWGIFAEIIRKHSNGR